MRPKNLKSKIFLDSGDPAETRRALDMLGFLDGQTTNPSLIAKNPEAAGKKFSKTEIADFYKKVVTEISSLIPAGSVSIEVYADASTTAEQMLEEGRKFYKWIPNAHIKFPTTRAGLGAAQIAVRDGMRVNMTLCFSQEQAAAVYAATRGGKKGQVYVSPFVGRLDDRGENGMDLIANIMEMYKAGDGHVEALSASIRNLDHLLHSISLGADILTVPFPVLKDWANKGLIMPGADYIYPAGRLRPIACQALDLNQSWQSFDIRHELTDKGLEKFSADWVSLMEGS